MGETPINVAFATAEDLHLPAGWKRLLRVLSRRFSYGTSQ
jgi:hypothetical protein